MRDSWPDVSARRAADSQGCDDESAERKPDVHELRKQHLGAQKIELRESSRSLRVASEMAVAHQIGALCVLRLHNDDGHLFPRLGVEPECVLRDGDI